MIQWATQFFEQLESTQAYLCQSALSYEEGTCIVARTQTQGYGRESRTWASLEGGLYFSFVLKPQKVLPHLPYALCWALIDVLETELHQQLQIKAPNDILFQQKKLAGLLIDAKIQGTQALYYVCGAGINVNQTSHPFALQSTAISMRQVSEKSYKINEILTAILQNFSAKYQLLLRDQFELAILAHFKKREIQIGYNNPTQMRFEEYWNANK